MLATRTPTMTLDTENAAPEGRGRTRAARRAMKRLRQQAMTLTEIMIVIIIMAMIAAAVGAAVIPKFIEAQVKTARLDVGSVRAAAESYRMTHGFNLCPTTETLIAEHELGRGTRTTDPWGKPFRIECAPDEVTVISGGRDGEFGGDDDIRIPE